MSLRSVHLKSRASVIAVPESNTNRVLRVVVAAAMRILVPPARVPLKSLLSAARASIELNESAPTVAVLCPA